MIVACGLDYKMLDEELQLEVIRTVRQHLLIPKGLRTLSPRNLLYKGSQEGGSPAERDFAGKNGSAWPWLLQFYVKACFDIDGDAFLPQAREILANFDEDIQSYGIGSICELYDADPPYASRGAISQAWSVGAVLNIHSMIRERTKEEPRESKTAGKAAKAVKLVAKSTAKKAAVKKTATDNTPKKTAAKTAVAKEAAEKKPAAKKSAEKKPTGKKPAATKARDKKDKGWEITSCEGRKILPRRDSGASGLATAACGREPGRSCERIGKNCKTRI